MTTTAELLRTPLHDWHVAHGARMVDFAGWSMPVQYKSIVEEHNATRNTVGIFDISHMGRLHFAGQNIAEFIDRVVTRRVTDLKPNQVRYALVCNAEGGILDDVLVYGGKPDIQLPYSMVVNASNREKIVSWLGQHAEPSNVSIHDYTTRSAMIAVQGPKAIETVQDRIIETAMPIAEMRYYTFGCGRWRGRQLLVSRTGYSGEDGIELICESQLGAELWECLLDHAATIGGMVAGLGARDTLRLEAAMPLYGHELSETINPIQAGLNFAVNLEGRDFIGRDALAQFGADKSQPVRVGLHVEGKRVARQGSPVLHNDEVVGEVTSGTFSPTLNRSIAMAYVQPAAHAIGTRLTVDIRGTQAPAEVVPLPFYARKKR